MEHTISAQLWRSPGASGWPFVTLPEDVADAVRARIAAAGSPFGRTPASMDGDAPSRRSATTTAAVPRLA